MSGDNGWQEEPTHDGVWWRRGVIGDALECVEVKSLDDAAGGGSAHVYHFGVDYPECYRRSEGRLVCEDGPASAWQWRAVEAGDEGERRRTERAAKAEREACALICDEAKPAEYACRAKDDERGDREHSAMHSARLTTLDAVAFAIRARST